jgi:methylenetetrahydrofolate reductase (NADPH)
MADFLFAQVGFSAERVAEWRASIEFAGPVYAGVMAIGSAQMAAKLTSEIPQLAVPAWLTERLERDTGAGVEFACEMVCKLRDSRAFDGVHLIPVRRYREVARRLEELL